MSTVVRPAPGASFVRRRVVRTASASVVVGMVAGMSLLVGAPADATTSADCGAGNTVDAATQSATDIQTLLSNPSGPSVICLIGTFPVATELQYDRTVTLFGLSDAVLDGGATNHRILEDQGLSSLTLQNLRLTGGRAAGDFGGAVLGYDVVAIGSVFDDDSAGYGGAIFAATVETDHSTFTGNTATTGGGAVVVLSSATLVSSLFDQNEGGEPGGAVFSYDVVTSTSSTFDDNHAQSGGAVFATTATLTGSTFTANRADFTGGAVTAGTLQATTSAFDQNQSGQYGGAVYSYNVLAVDSSTFDANTAEDAGGAAVAFGTYDVKNATLVDNSVTAVSGAFGAAADLTGSGTVQQSTFLDNHAVDSGAGQAIFSDSGSTLTLRGNVFAHDPGDPQIVIDSGTSVDQGGNLFTTSQATEASFTGAGPGTKFGLTTLALLGSATLADNGGDVETVALPAGSPAIDGVPGASTVTVDARGVGRTPPNDSGAYEYVAPIMPAILPATGVDPGWLAGLAAALLALGALGLRLAQRARRTTSRS